MKGSFFIIKDKEKERLYSRICMNIKASLRKGQWMAEVYINVLNFNMLVNFKRGKFTAKENVFGKMEQFTLVIMLMD